MNLKPAFIILFAAFVMAELIVETEPFLLGERIQSENERIWYLIIWFEVHVIWCMFNFDERNELLR